MASAFPAFMRVGVASRPPGFSAGRPLIRSAGRRPLPPGYTIHGVRFQAAFNYRSRRISIRPALAAARSGIFIIFRRSRLRLRARPHYGIVNLFRIIAPGHFSSLLAISVGFRLRFVGRFIRY